MADFGFVPELISTGNISPFRFVELATSAEFSGQQANAASDTILGVTDGSVYAFNQSYNAVAGTQINLQSSNTVQIELGAGGCSIGSLLTSDSNGCAVVGSAGNVCFYIALQSGSAGDIVRAFRFAARTA